MENSLTVLHSLLKDKEVNTQCFTNGLAFVEECQLLNFTENAKVNEIVSLINAALHDSSGDRLRALQILEKCSKQCSNDIFTSNAILWMQHCTQWSPQTVNVELKILNHLITRSVGNPDLKKQINAIMIPRIVERLNSCSSTAKRTVILKLVCLRSLIDGYSSSCSPFRTHIYKYIMFTLKNYSECDEIILPAARCLVSLHSCGSAGQQGANYKERWTSQFSACISTYHKLIDKLYGDIEQMKIGSEKLNETTFDDFLELKSEYQTSPTMRYFGLRRSCNVLTSMMQAMLLCKFPVSKSFNVKDTMNLICRILSVTYVTLKDESLTNDIIALGANLPSLHLCAFDLLEAVIICAKRNLIVHSTLICKLCIQSLKWISSIARANENIQPFQEVKKKAYHTLSTWLSTAGSCSSVEVFADELIPLLIPNIECRKQSLTLLLDPQKKKGKRKRGQFNSEISLNAEGANSSSGGTDESVCCLAHNTLQLTLRNASIFIKWEHHKTLQTVIVNQLLDIQKCNSEREYPSMYSDSRCRLMLYGSLLTLLTEPHPKWFAPTSYAVNFFNAGVDDSQIDISTFCKFAITQIEAINHPKAPSLNFVNESVRKDEPASTMGQLLAATESTKKTPYTFNMQDITQISEKQFKSQPKDAQFVVHSVPEMPAKLYKHESNAPNSNESVVKEPSTTEKQDTLKFQTSKKRVNPEESSVLSESTYGRISGDAENIVLESKSTDSPSPKKCKIDVTEQVIKAKMEDSASSNEKSKQSDSNISSTSINSTADDTTSAMEGNSTDKGSIWPKEDADVDSMLQDFVDEV